MAETKFPDSPVLRRLIEEVRNEQNTPINQYNRLHNRHNRSGGYNRAHNRHHR